MYGFLQLDLLGQDCFLLPPLFLCRLFTMSVVTCRECRHIRPSCRKKSATFMCCGNISIVVFKPLDLTFPCLYSSSNAFIGLLGNLVDYLCSRLRSSSLVDASSFFLFRTSDSVSVLLLVKSSVWILRNIFAISHLVIGDRQMSITLYAIIPFPVFGRNGIFF